MSGSLPHTRRRLPDTDASAFTPTFDRRIQFMRRHLFGLAVIPPVSRMPGGERPARARPRPATTRVVPKRGFKMRLWQGFLAITLISNAAAAQPGDPESIGFAMADAGAPIDLADFVVRVAAAADVAATIATAKPAYAGYRALERALLRYRQLAADSSLRLPQLTSRSIRPGDEYRDIATVARLLAALGDLDPNRVDSTRAGPDSASAPLYTGAIVDAIVNFQRRHGLETDGVIGPATMAQLRVPLARRVRQIELTLERWRWLPRHPPDRYIVVNIPGFRLYAFEDDPVAEHPALAMNVIVGKANGRHHTPVFTATMREVVFRPYWDVPARIARTELIPAFRRTPAMFANQGFEIVRPGASEVRAPTFPPTQENLARVAAGNLRIRQRPGAANALGFVKFVLPNRNNVFLHDTPTRDLFAKARRDFSHGCVRVAQPDDLAEFVLRGQAPWTRAAIDSMLRGKRTLHVPLAQSVPVFIVYATAVATSEGTVSFYPDLYKHDVALERALGLAPAARQ